MRRALVRFVLVWPPPMSSAWHLMVTVTGRGEQVWAWAMAGAAAQQNASAQSEVFIA